MFLHYFEAKQVSTEKTVNQQVLYSDPALSFMRRPHLLKLQLTFLKFKMMEYITPRSAVSLLEFIFSLVSLSL